MASHRRNPSPRPLTPEGIYTVLRQTASDVRLRNEGGNLGPQPVRMTTIADPLLSSPKPFSYDSGYGFVDALRALQAVSTGQ